jgi:sterol desaturase/sphingolipid hydroxylase (fatty acid hydroxylase superfamily)
MVEAILENELVVRLGFFLAVFSIIALWELPMPRRKCEVSRWGRWPSNLGIVAFDAVLVRVFIPATTVTMALIAEEGGWGLFNQLVLPGWAAVLFSVIALDLVIYLQHVMFHAVPILWRFHRVHHADLDFDVTTGVRFHPIEILLSMGIKLAAVAVLGVPGIAVLIFEVLLNATSMFNHGNVRLPSNLDRVLRWIVVTPDMHRVHHSIIPREANSNFGFNLPWWDRLLGTYRAQPADGHEGMVIGIGQFRTRRDLWLDWMLSQPFRGNVGDYPLSGRESGPSG